MALLPSYWTLRRGTQSQNDDDSCSIHQLMDRVQLILIEKNSFPLKGTK